MQWKTKTKKIKQWFFERIIKTDTCLILIERERRHKSPISTVKWTLLQIPPISIKRLIRDYYNFPNNLNLGEMYKFF